MEREFRYFVLKNKDMLKYLNEEERRLVLELGKKVEAGRKADGRGPFECVCIESDWPEYDQAWWSIAARVDRERGIGSLRSKLDQIERYGVGERSGLPAETSREETRKSPDQN
ncbi:hypothetical protein [Geoalkalibacter subterraneus]|uniref:hypothetical protein n=1 Tax=Geoalkalibacter subterraneus TaxID=483547 RepID=UPI0006932859|nr:hypothetical protein [Geoalkalibacter subterraneus]